VLAVAGDAPVPKSHAQAVIGEPLLADVSVKVTVPVANVLVVLAENDAVGTGIATSLNATDAPT
jgi:hypothetical protein